MSSRFDQPFTLASMADAFPVGLPEAPNDLPNYKDMDFNVFCSRLELAYVGTFEVPIANVNQHKFQRAIVGKWVAELQEKFRSDGINSYVHPGVGILNTEEVPLGADGKPDGSEMRLSLLSAGHRSSAVAGMPTLNARQKVWVFRVYQYRMSLYCAGFTPSSLISFKDLHFAADNLLHLWISSFNQTSDRLEQHMTQNFDIILMVAIEAYTPQNAHTNRKITNAVNHLEKGVKEIVRPFVNNPRLVSILTKISQIPLWRSGFITSRGMKNLLECKWSPEVSNQYDSINNTLILIIHLSDDGRGF
jgi:hypothetical protein